MARSTPNDAPIVPRYEGDSSSQQVHASRSYGVGGGAAMLRAVRSYEYAVHTRIQVCTMCSMGTMWPVGLWVRGCTYRPHARPDDPHLLISGN